MSAMPDSTFADPKDRLIADLQRQLAASNAERNEALAERDKAQWALAECTAERDEALEQQTATAEVLQVINSSPGDLAPVFDAMLEKAMRLCDAAFGGLWTFDEDRYVAVALRNVPKPYAEFLSKTSLMPGPGTGAYRLRCGERLVHNVDLVSEEPYRSGDPQRRALVDLGGARTALQVALRKEKGVLGVITVYRQEMRPFSENQITVLQNFAAQAVIAMENARLITELQQRTHDLQESLEYQTASSDVLKVISRSTFDLQPVLDTLVETAARICRANSGFIFRLQDGLCRMVASFGIPSEYRDFQAQNPIPPGRGTLAGRTVLERRAVHIEDATIDREYTRAEAVQLGHQRTMLGVPLIRGEALIGVITLARSHVEPFTEKQIGLVTTFADQAIIAIENARLLNELRERTRDLEESLNVQTATSDMLKLISRSTFDLQPVLAAVTETAARLCLADVAYIATRAGDVYRMAAGYSLSPDFEAFVRAQSYVPGRESVTGRTILKGRVVHVADVDADAEYAIPETVTVGKIRTVLGVPLLREGEPIGVIALGRQQVEPFTERQIELVRTFTDQAVIAMENARLLNEIRQRQAELRVTFDNMGDGVAMFDAQHRLAAWNRNFQRMLDLPDGILEVRLSFAEYFDYLAKRGEYGSADLEAKLRHDIEETGRELRFERTRPDGRIVEVRRNSVPGGGFVLIYSDITERKRSEAEIRVARDAAETALRNLQAAQANLVQAQKMAALGQLTAGIAHEIKNPLNFVNNFAGLSIELLDELQESTAPGIATLDEDTRAEIDETIEMLTSNLDKIAEHGKRADNIVKSMLEHSRGVSGEQREVDLNALIDEALNLAYHGARAQDQSFNITLERDFQPGLAPIEVAPQEITRVFLNLFSNGFYAGNRRARESGDGAFRPTLAVATREDGDAIEITVRDNGTGIPPEIRDKLFQPFFTTKPTGEGTGLGLSISYDIITQQHGGTITVESEPGAYTEFTIRLPRRAAVGGAA